MFAAAPPVGPAPDPRQAIAYSGEAALREPLISALAKVVDPEMSVNIVDLGLVYALAQTPQEVVVTITMTSAACPVAELIMAEIENELDRVLPASCAIAIDLVWDPPWSAERMSARARRAFGWDDPPAAEDRGTGGT
jgi:metal-sulfur cluster biosynthetic enzyme